jgi:hypothetical protein
MLGIREREERRSGGGEREERALLEGNGAGKEVVDGKKKSLEEDRGCVKSG